MAKILIADDDPSMVMVLSELLRSKNHEVIPANSAERVSQLIKENPADLVLLDLEMPTGNPSGLQLLREVKNYNNTIPVIMITGASTKERELESLRLGAYDYITKPFRMDEVLKRVENALFHQKAVHAINENVSLKQQLRDKYRFENIIGKSPPMEAVFRMIDRVANTDSTVLIVGESGTGKELVAKALHQNSRRAEMPFMPINCGALPEQLLESELFGHRRGSYTGAHFDRNGLFQEANGGTVFLDEVSSMSAALQTKLLRVLQEREVRRVGDNITTKVDVRVLAATNEPLEKRIQDGRFREDLFYRLNVICIQMPPLRDRREDIPLIAEHFLRKFSPDPNRPVKIAPETMDLLMSYHWPGNVRELENILERGAILCDQGQIRPKDLPASFHEALGKASIQTATHGVSAPTNVSLLTMSAFPSAHGQTLSLDDFVAQQERHYINAVLAQFDGDKDKAAQSLGISLATLYRKLKS